MSKVQDIIAKIEATPVYQAKKVASAFSGGLDSCLGIELLRRKYKAKEIIPITVDIGQGDEEMEMARTNSRKMGLEPDLHRRARRVLGRVGRHGHQGQLRLRRLSRLAPA